MTESRRFTLVVAAVMVLAVAAFGQSQPVVNTADAYIDNQVTVNQCSTAEPVALNGKMHFTSTFTTDSSGVNHFAVTVANDLTGIGQTTATNYSGSDTNDYTANTSQQSAELAVEFKSDLNSQGPGPNLTLVQALHIMVDTAGNITGEVTQNTTQCGSGS